MMGSRAAWKASKETPPVEVVAEGGQPIAIGLFLGDCDRVGRLGLSEVHRPLALEPEIAQHLFGVLVHSLEQRFTLHY